MSRTRVKICGITREQDLADAVRCGADALGLVFYPPSPRYLDDDRAALLARRAPPFVTLVGLFVNEDAAVVRRIISSVPLQLLQFHGEEDAAYCAQFGLPYIKAARVRPGLDLLEYAASFPDARGLLLDAHVDGYGGGGRTFDWGLIPQGLPQPVILSGGLHAGNVAAAIEAVRPWAVDVSSGVELAGGVKDVQKIAEFVAGVRSADAR